MLDFDELCFRPIITLALVHVTDAFVIAFLWRPCDFIVKLMYLADDLRCNLGLALWLLALQRQAPFPWPLP